MKQGVNSVEVVSLDEYFGEDVFTFLKVDVEGSEAELINGATKLLIITDQELLSAFVITQQTYLLFPFYALKKCGLCFYAPASLISIDGHSSIL